MGRRGLFLLERPFRDYGGVDTDVQLLVAKSAEKLRRDGLWITLQQARRYLSRDRIADDFDVKHGTETGGVEPIWNFHISSPNRRFGRGYTATNEQELTDAINFLREDPQKFTFIDLGCGKARTLLVAANLGFKQVIGVEFVHELAETARKNLAKMRILNAVVVETDAAEYRFPDTDMVVYLFNPFTQEVVQKVVANLRESSSKKLYVMYKTPCCAANFDASGFLTRLGTAGRHDIMVWRATGRDPETAEPLGAGYKSRMEGSKDMLRAVTGNSSPAAVRESMELPRVLSGDTRMSRLNPVTQTIGASAATRLVWPSARKQRPSFRWSDIWRAPLHDFPIRDEILYQFLSLSAEMNVLEVGPGSGFTAFRLSRAVRRMTLVDVSALVLRDLRAQLEHAPNLDFICADLSRPGLAAQVEQEFDVAFGLDVFEYVVDPAACLQNLASVLRPDGELFLSYPNVPPPVGDGVTFFSRQRDLDELLAEAGFSRWDTFAVRLGPFAAGIFRALHEWPLRLYRRLGQGERPARPQTYEATWTFQQRQKLFRYKTALHLFWAALRGVMLSGGDIFLREPVTDGIVGRQLVIRAWR